MDPHNPRNWHWPEGIPESLANTEERMAVKTLHIKHNTDDTITIKVNNYVESIEIQGKTNLELFEAIKWAIICGHFQWNDEIATLVATEISKIRRY
jgi:hypothetical protein